MFSRPARPASIQRLAWSSASQSLRQSLQLQHRSQPSMIRAALPAAPGCPPRSPCFFPPPSRSFGSTASPGGRSPPPFLACVQQRVIAAQTRARAPLVLALNEASRDNRVRQAADELNAEFSETMRIETGVADLDECNRLLKLGEFQGVISGADTATGDVIRSALKNVGLKSGCKTVASYFVMDLGESWLQRQLIFADCAVVPDPKAEQLADICLLAAEAAKTMLEGEEPAVAMLSFSTKGSAAHRMPQKVIEALEMVRGRAPDLLVDGEMQFDAAFVPEILAKKTGGESVLVGKQVNTFIFPDLNAGNIGYKLVQRLVPNARAIGPIVMGLAAPSNDLSRGCSVQDIKDLVWLTAASAQQK